MKRRILLIIVIPIVALLGTGTGFCGQNPVQLVLTGHFEDLEFLRLSPLGLVEIAINSIMQGKLHNVEITTDKTHYKPGDNMVVTVKNTGLVPVTLTGGSGGFHITHLNGTGVYLGILDAAATVTFSPCSRYSVEIPLMEEESPMSVNKVPVKPGMYKAKMYYVIEENGEEKKIYPSTIFTVEP